MVHWRQQVAPDARSWKHPEAPCHKTPMNSSLAHPAGAHAGAARAVVDPVSTPCVLFADPDAESAVRIVAELRELGWNCEIAPGIWEALGLIESVRFTHLVARLHQMGPDDLGGMLLAWTWLRTGRSCPLVLGSTPEVLEDPSVIEGRILLAPSNAGSTEIWNRLSERRAIP